MEELGSVDTDALVARCCKVVPVRNSPESAVRIDVLEPSFEKRLSALQRDIVHRISANPELRHRSSVEWFLDNFYLISETTLALRQELPVRFYGQLPAVSTDTGSQQPRIYVLAVEFLAHQFSTLARAPQRASFENFLDEFQQRVPLTIGELWAFPAILRAVCLERIVGLVSEVSRASSDAAIDNESDVALSVQTLISLKAMPWTEVFENASLVHRELARNPAGSYARSDFATRDSYRNVVEELAAHAECDEVAVAERANAVATSGHGPTFDRTRDVGYYLLDRGQQELKSALGIKPSLGTRCRRFIRRSATPIYLTSIATATLAILVPLALYLESLSGSGMSIALFCSIAIIPTSAFAVAWVQWLITHMVAAKKLPRLSMEHGIDDACKTVVVIPTLFGDLEEVHRLVKRLELHYLANPEANLRFAILADYTDALTEIVPRDEELLSRARDGIDLLNQKYCPNESGGAMAPFHLLVRARRFNSSEGVWMGWERKRGKLEEFNRLLAGHQDTSYAVHVGDARGLEDIRFVITLDSDTELPRDAARRLVATLAHPLNRARIQGGKLTAGYTVLQPRLDISPDSSFRSRFSKIFAGDTGLDIYSLAVSDVYQDFFGSGIYVGKGIYDVDAFRQCLEGRVPENALLSHDLFEGIYGRAALVTDIVLYEDYPPNYLAYAKRLHRWIRGDWQLLPWLRLRVPVGEGRRILNPFSHIDRWKVLDNLRRSLLPVTLLALFVSGWTWLPGSAAVWTGVALVLSSGHVLCAAATKLRGLFGLRGRSVLRSFADFPQQVYRWLISLAFLPHEALLVVDAIARTSLRMAFTRERLLEWTTAAHTARLWENRGQRLVLWREMLNGPICAAGVGAMVFLQATVALVPASALIVAWFLSPEIALFLSHTKAEEVKTIEAGDRQWLRKLARRTWLFFETFVGPDDHWLPPDNVQMVPSLRIAHRTSPTNIGLYLVSCASACDLGHLGLRSFCARTKHTMRTLTSLPRYRGQLLNWYETQTLEALSPQYVSTVDNGNFAAAMIAVRNACSGFATGPVFPRQFVTGLGDMVALLEESVRHTDETSTAASIAAMRRCIAAAQSCDAHECPVQLANLAAHVSTFSETLRPNELGHEALHWLEVLSRHIEELRQEAEALTGWAALLFEAPIHERAVRSQARDLISACRGLALDELPSFVSRVESFLDGLSDEADDSHWILDVRKKLAQAAHHASTLLSEVLDVGVACEDELAKIDFRFLYDDEAHQMFIGYDVSSSQPDRHHYDLLASEARLASLVAIALGHIPTKHWVHLGRPLARIAGHSALLSWSGTMFEYAMPLLFTRSFPKTLLGRSTLAAIRRQIRYGRRLGVPWGISESGFAATDARGDYQYRAFGTPGLGLKRGLADDVVVAPYASVLVVGLMPYAVLDNLRELEELGVLGEYGAMEAIDFTPGRTGLPLGRSSLRGSRKGNKGSVVQSYMAHHQGMSLVALGNALADESMVDRFHGDPRIQTVAHLLQEKLPDHAPKQHLPDSSDTVSSQTTTERVVPVEPWKPMSQKTAASSLVDPALHVLSAGHLSLLIDSFGRSRLCSVGLTTPHEEVEVRARDFGAPHDRVGGFCTYLQINDESARLLSGGLSAHAAFDERVREVTFWPHKVEMKTRWGFITALEDVFLAPEGVEIRRLRLSNEGSCAAVVRVTGCANIALGSSAEHHRHPAFSRLFLQTKARDGGRVLTCRRRPRAKGQRPPVIVQTLLGETHEIEWETSRRAFIGRLGTPEAPEWIQRNLGVPAGSQGAVLDPVLAQRVAVFLPGGGTETIAWVTAVGSDEQQALEQCVPYRQLAVLSAVQDRSARAVSRQLGARGFGSTDVQPCQELLSQLVHRPHIRPPAAEADRRILWSHGVSGDRSVLLVHHRGEDEGLVGEILRAHQWLLGHHVGCDLVFILHNQVGYLDETREQLRRQVRAIRGLDVDHTTFFVSSGQLKPSDLLALEAAAGVVLDTEAGCLAEQLSRGIHEPKLIPAFISSRPRNSVEVAKPVQRREDLLCDNGHGGFDPQDGAYVLHLEKDGRSTTTPAPWCNVLSNPSFGTFLSERGLGYTWAHNASENRLTPWSNDPVCDPLGEAVYLRDEETGEFWSVTPGPRPGAGMPYEVTHGIGSTRFRHGSYALAQTTVVAVHPREPAKLVELEIENLTERPRRLTVTYFAEWVLGARHATHGPYVVASYDAEARALLAQNPWNLDFPKQTAFLATSGHVHGFTLDRIEFLGVGGPSDPDALLRWGLSNSERAGPQTCAALQVHIDLAANETYRFHFVLGWGCDQGAAQALAKRSAQPAFAREVKMQTHENWSDVLSRAVVSLPDPAADVMLNRWVAYQAISCRLYARTGFYQSSGAIGFRDQLQDALCLALITPALARKQILEAAAHQFDAGDVLHWWHPPHGRGVRTRCSDDLLWLPFAVSTYLETTGDGSILDESVSFLVGPELGPDEDERYSSYGASDSSASILEHCVRALERAYRLGPQGLPLIGSGDWNDGMNLVGQEGRGESVWLGWFLVTVMRRFAAACKQFGRDGELGFLEDRCRALLGTLEAAWDGEWYRRAYYDDGTPLGSADSKEARIDSISQSWAVISGAADPGRARQAVLSAAKELVDDDGRLIRLLWPPFDRERHEPGYIKGYPPGIRENGAQYTHAAIWLVWALYEIGECDRATELFQYLNPITHSLTLDDAKVYALEPYVLAGDVYSVPPHRGQGGWSWYTGSAAWYWRLGIEVLLGCRVRWPYLEILPRIPSHWPHCRVTLKLVVGSYDIHIVNAVGSYDAVVEANLDGRPLSHSGTPRIDLREQTGDHLHRVRVVLGRQGQHGVQSANP